MKHIIPLHWTGRVKVGDPAAPDAVFVCGACAHPEQCAAEGRCDRAADSDYEYGRWMLGKTVAHER